MSEQVGRDAVPGFGDKVRELREAKGWSQPQLAERAGTHFTTVSKIEKGERSASLQLALRLADALGVAIIKLIPANWKERLEAGAANGNQDAGKAETTEKPKVAAVGKSKNETASRKKGSKR